jgi:hypothetical protein
VIEARWNFDAKIGATEDDAVVGSRGPQGDVDPQSGMQTNADAPDRRLQRALARISPLDQISRQTVHAPRLVSI